MKKLLVLKTFLFFLLSNFFCYTQYWQQKIDYKISVDLDDSNSTYKGTQKIVYKNNSPETLKKIYFHLYFNAFQPESDMSIRLKNNSDKNVRFSDNFNKNGFSKLSKSGQGYLKVFNLKQNGSLVKTLKDDTILEVFLNTPIKSGQKTVFELSFQGKVPDVIRRAGKNSKENIAYSMAQWYPKICEYDIDGWNTDPYTGREFHGVWGNYDVKIKLNKQYTVAATGYLKNAKQIGHGYHETNSDDISKEKLTWHFTAPNVHDFTWSADKEYIHDIFPGPNGVSLHFFYKNNPKIIENWKKLQPITAKLMDYFNTKIGMYPYKQYTVAQGADGGMEYPMITLITGEREFRSLVGVTAHELAHSWFHTILATNETKHEWMDEGFTTYISNIAENEILNENVKDPIAPYYRSYLNLALSGKEQPQTSNANRYNFNAAYEITAYSKGALFLSQLKYIIGEKLFFKTLNEYYSKYQFKHPTPTDFRRTAESVSDIHLDWFLTEWTQTTNKIDYSIEDVTSNLSVTEVSLKRKELMPMPVEVSVYYNDGSVQLFYIPFNLMRGNKRFELNSNIKLSKLKSWSWSNPHYSFKINKPLSHIKKILIDENEQMADIDRENNLFVVE